MADTTTLEEIVTPLKTLWRFDYETNVKALRDLYELAKKEQWNAALDIPWEKETDPLQVGDMNGPGGDQFDFIKALSVEKQQELAKRRSTGLLSQFLHGEQGAMLCCGQLVEAVPDMDGKLYAATQVIDEARHVEVFARYIKRLGPIQPMMPGLKSLINAVLQADLWQMKCIGMQVIAESLAMGSFKTMKETTGDDVLRQVVTLTMQDEARHVSYGLIYMGEELPKMSEPDRDRIEDFAWAALGLLMGPQTGARRGPNPQMELFAGLGIDPEAAADEMRSKFSDPAFRAAQPNPFRDFVIPQLNRIGLLTERTAGKYREAGLMD